MGWEEEEEEGPENGVLVFEYLEEEDIEDGEKYDLQVLSAHDLSV